MAEYDHDIQRGSSTELTQLFEEQNVDLGMGPIYDFTALPDGNIVVVTHHLDGYGRVGVFDATNMNKMSENFIQDSTYLINSAIISASVVSIGVIYSRMLTNVTL